MSSPQRIQLSRRRGWRMSQNTIKCDRTTRLGNPFRVDGTIDKRFIADSAWIYSTSFLLVAEIAWSTQPTAQKSIDLFRRALMTGVLKVTVDDVRRDLRGKNLACWCALSEPCHCDVLLEVANA